MNFSVILLLLSSVFLIEATVDLVCELPSVFTVPTNFKYKSEKHFGYAGSALQIFTSAVVACDGYVRAWRFISNTPAFFGLHLAVFRQRDGYFFFINSTYISASFAVIRSYPFGDSIKVTAGQWVELVLQESFPVQKGDYLGVFYDKLHVIEEGLAIKTAQTTFKDSDNLKLQPTFVFMEDDVSLQTTSTSMCTRKMLDPDKGDVSFREPALTAVVTSSPYMEYQPPFDLAVYIYVPEADMPMVPQARQLYDLQMLELNPSFY